MGVVRAPIIEAQLVETYLLSTFVFQTMVASKAARCVLAGEGRPIVEFGSRRAHSPGAGVLGARGFHRWLRRHEQHGSGHALRHSGVRYGRAFVDDGVP